MATIRPATEADLAAILAIYNHAVMKTTAIWNEAPSDLESRRIWLSYAKPMGRPLVETYITEVSQDTWILFPWDQEPAMSQPIIERLSKRAAAG